MAEGQRKQPAATPVTPAKPLRPRPVLFWVLMAAFVAWLGVLVGLYFRT